MPSSTVTKPRPVKAVKPGVKPKPRSAEIRQRERADELLHEITIKNDDLAARVSRLLVSLG